MEDDDGIVVSKGQLWLQKDGEDVVEVVERGLMRREDGNHVYMVVYRGMEGTIWVNKLLAFEEEYVFLAYGHLTIR